MASAGWVLTAGQPVTRTLPPLTTAAARNGTALDRSGSMIQCRAAIGPGETRQRLAWVSSTSTPASRSIATVIATCGADGTDSPVCTMVRPSVNAAPDSSSPDTNCDEADASISTVPPATDPPPRTENGRPSPSMSTPSPRNASSSGAIGRARACSSPSNTTVSVPSAATGGTNRSTVPARPQSTRRIGGGAIAPLTVSSVSSPSTVTPSVRTRADHQVGVAAAQRAADGRRALRGGQRGEHQRPVGLRLRARHRHRRVHGARRRRCLPVAHGLHPALSQCFCHHGIYVWAIRGNHRSGAAGREDPGDRRGARRQRQGLRRVRTTTSRRPPRSAPWSNGTASPTTSRRGGCG